MIGQMKHYRNVRLSGPYFKKDIPNVNIDYRGLVAFAKKKGVLVCNLSDEEKNLFIKGSDMNKVRAVAIK